MHMKLFRLPQMVLLGLITILILAACSSPDPVTSLTVSHDSVSLSAGESTDVTASLKTRADKNHPGRVTWTTSDEAVATVDSGTITAVAAGEAIVTASFANLQAEVEVTVVAEDLEVTGLRVAPGLLALVVGEVTTGQLTAELVYEDDSTAHASGVEWSSSATEVATVDATGMVAAVAPGSAIITASAGEFTAFSHITVVNPVSPADPIDGLEVLPASVHLLPGDSVDAITRFTHESGMTSPTTDVAWSSDSEAIATVTDGKIRAVAVGTATITATANDQSGSISVTVTAPPAPEDKVTALEFIDASLDLVVFEYGALYAQHVHESGATSPASLATWSSSNTDVANVSAPGVVRAIGPGTADITVSSNGFSAMATVTVTDPVIGLVIKPALTISISSGDSVTLGVTTVTATGIEDDVTAHTVWSSSNSEVATVASNIVTAHAGGVTEITAVYEDLRVTAQVSVSSSSEVFVGNAPTQPAGALGTALNPFPTIGDALAPTSGINHDATITLLPGWDGVEYGPVELIAHKLVGTGVGTTVISLANADTGCFVISLGEGASIADLSVDGTNVRNNNDAVCAGAGARGVSVIGVDGVTIENIHVFDDTVVTDSSSEARRFTGIHIYDANDITLTEVQVSDTTRDAIQISGGSVEISGATISNAAQFEPGYGGIAAYSTAQAGATSLTVLGEISFLEMPDNVGIILSSRDGTPLEFNAGDAHLVNDDSRFPIAVWRGLKDIILNEAEIKEFGVNYYAFGATADAATNFTHNGFIFGIAHNDPQIAVEAALSYKDPIRDIGPRPLVVDAEFTTVYVGQSPTQTMSVQDAIDFAAAAAHQGLSLEVEVLLGSYIEQLRISSSVAVTGAGIGVTRIIAPTAEDMTAVMDNANYAHNTYAIVDINGIDVEARLSGLTVSGPFIGLNIHSTNTGYGVRVAGGAHLEFWDSEVLSIRNEPLNGNQSGIGLVLGRANENTHGTATIRNVNFSDFQKGAVLVDGTESYIEIVGGMLQGIVTPRIAQNGIQISRGAAGTVTSVTFEDFVYTGGTDRASAILSYQAGSAGLALAHNTFSNYDIALGVLDGSNESYSVTGNTFATSVTRGQHISNGSNALIDLVDAGNSFNGVVASGSTPLDQLYAIERRIVHGVDNPSLARVQLVANNLYVSDTHTLRNAIVVAEPGMTINAAPGTYGMQMTEASLAVINKPLTLLGPNAGIAGYEARVDEATLVVSGHNSARYGIRIEADNVTVDGFAITTDTPMPADSYPNGIYGIYVSPATTANAGIRNNYLVNTNFPIWVNRGRPSTSATGFVIERNFIQGPQAASDQAIMVQHAVGVIRDNVIRDARVGIQVQPYHQEGAGNVENNDMEVFQVGLWFNYPEVESSAWRFEGNVVIGTDTPQHWTWPLWTTDPDAWSGIRIETLNEGNVRFSENSIHSGSTEADIAYLVRQKTHRSGEVHGIGTMTELGEFFTTNLFPEFPMGVTLADLTEYDDLVQLVAP